MADRDNRVILKPEVWRRMQAKSLLKMLRKGKTVIILPDYSRKPWRTKR